MEGRVTEAVELIGMVPKIMKQGGLTKMERARIDSIMKNFNETKRSMEKTGKFSKVDRDRYRSMQQAYQQLSTLPNLKEAPLSSIANITSGTSADKTSDQPEITIKTIESEIKVSWDFEGVVKQRLIDDSDRQKEPVTSAKRRKDALGKASDF